MEDTTMPAGSEATEETMPEVAPEAPATEETPAA
jgi:hypothetical protein